MKSLTPKFVSKQQSNWIEAAKELNWAESTDKQWKKRRNSNYDVCYLFIKLGVFTVQMYQSYHFKIEIDGGAAIFWYFNHNK